MSYKVSGKTIILTRGDSANIKVSVESQDGGEYSPQEGDIIRFAVKKAYTDDSPTFVKQVDIKDMYIRLEPSDTKGLDFGRYVFDVELMRANGYTDTFIDKGTLQITEEVY